MADITVTTGKFLSLTGLQHYDAKLKSWVTSQITDINSSVADIATIRGNAEKGLTAYNAWASFLADTPTGTVTPTLAQLATSDSLTQAINNLKNGASEGYDTLKGLEDKIKEVATSVANKNVSAEGESGDSALINASATDNKVTVTSTKKLQDAVSLAESALQDVTVATGDNNGEIKVQGHAVAVKGLGSAAYTNSTDYDAAGSADDALTAAKEYADDLVMDGETPRFDANGAAATAEQNAKEYADGLNTAMDDRVKVLEDDKHNHSNKDELDLVKSGDVAKWDAATTAINEFLTGTGTAEVVDTLKDIQEWMNGEGVDATELTAAIAAEAKSREDADKAINDKIGTVSDGKDVVTMISDAEDAAKEYADDLVMDGETPRFDANGAAATAEQNAKEYADGLNTAMDDRVKVLEAIDHDAYKAADDTVLASARDYVDNKVDGKFDVAGAAATAEANAKTYTDTKVAECVKVADFITSDEINALFITA